MLCSKRFIDVVDTVDNLRNQFNASLILKKGFSKEKPTHVQKRNETNMEETKENAHMAHSTSLL